MDNEYQHPHSEAQQGGAPALTAAESAAPAEAAAVIEQVRELLFGDHRRATENSLKGLEDRIAALMATIEARFADLERRLQEGKSETDKAHSAQVESIGAALAEFAERIKGLSGKHSI